MIFDCKICTKTATIMVQTGTLNLLEVRDLKVPSKLIYDWTGGGGINHYFCQECFDGIAKDIWKKGGEYVDSL